MRVIVVVPGCCLVWYNFVYVVKSIAKVVVPGCCLVWYNLGFLT